jgi:hypothetical protein
MQCETCGRDGFISFFHGELTGPHCAECLRKRWFCIVNYDGAVRFMGSSYNDCMLWLEEQPRVGFTQFHVGPYSELRWWVDDGTYRCHMPAKHRSASW